MPAEPMSGEEYPPIPEELVDREDIELGWMALPDGVYLVRAEVELRQLTSMPAAGNISVLGRRGSQNLDWLVLRPYILRDPGFTLPNGIAQEALWPEDVGAVSEHIGMIQATYYPRDRALVLDQFEVLSGQAARTNPAIRPLLRGIEQYLCNRYLQAGRLVVSQDHSYVAIEGKEGFLLSEGFAMVTDHPARFEKAIQTYA